MTVIFTPNDHIKITKIPRNLNHRHHPNQYRIHGNNFQSQFRKYHQRLNSPVQSLINYYQDQLTGFPTIFIHPPGGL